MELTEELKTREAAKSMVYRRLADAFRPPEPGLEEGLLELGAALNWLGSVASTDVARMHESFVSEKGIDALKVDYTRLFLGPFLVPVPPYGSVYLEEERRIMGDSTVDARGHYLLLGLDLSEDFKEAPDHIAAELEFMHVLTCRVHDAIESQNSVRLSQLLDQRESFFRKHIGAWVPIFADKMAEHAQTPFYRCLAAAIGAFVAEELDRTSDQSVRRETEACPN